MAEKLLLTGATGFLGSQLVRHLCNDSHEIVILKRSTSDTQRIEPFLSSLRLYDLDKTPLEKIFKENSFQTIIHCATDYGRKQVQPLQIVEANLLLPLKLLQFG